MNVKNFIDQIKKDFIKIIILSVMLSSTSIVFLNLYSKKNNYLKITISEQNTRGQKLLIFLNQKKNRDFGDIISGLDNTLMAHIRDQSIEAIETKYNLTFLRIENKNEKIKIYFKSEINEKINIKEINNFMNENSSNYFKNYYKEYGDFVVNYRVEEIKENINLNILIITSIFISIILSVFFFILKKYGKKIYLVFE